MTKYISIIVNIFIIVVLAGCSGNSNPICSVNTQGSPDQTQSIAPQNRALWGIWQCSMEPGSEQIQVVPLRGAMFTANVNNLLEANPGNLLIQDMDITNFLTEGRLDCTVTLKHPFPGLDMYNGFDVWGVFMHNGASELNYDSLVYGDGSGDDEATLLNPDGWTRWFNYTEFDGTGSPLLEYHPGKLSDLPDPSATLNPYRIFADDLDAEDSYYDWITTSGNADNRGWFAAGSVNSRRYELQFPIVDDNPVVSFQYAVIATWEPGDPTLTGSPSYYDPGDFPTSANCEEAFFIHAITDDSDLYYAAPDNYGGTFSADIEVFDWQGGSVGEPGVPNEINRMIIEGDFIPGGSHEFSQAELAMVANPATVNSSVFQVDIINCIPQASGNTDCWVIVEAAGLNGESFNQGFPTEYPEGAYRAAFIMSMVNISDISAGLSVTSIDPDTVPFWSTVENAVITGTEFADGATVELRKESETPIQGANVQWISETTIHCDFDLKGADSGAWDVIVINPSLAEGTLEDGFAIDVWSEETVIETGGYRLPALEEMLSGPVVLAVGQNNSTMQYMIWDPTGDGWEGPHLLDNNPGNSRIIPLASDPNDDKIYCFATSHKFYRYQGGTGQWEEAYHPVYGNRTAVITVDFNSRLHFINNTQNSFGWIVHYRTSIWPPTSYLDYEIAGDYFPNAVNSLYLSEGNCIVYDSSGNMYVIYCKDNSLSPYLGYPPAGPRYIRVTPLPGGGSSNGYSTIEQLSGVDIALDSPALTIDQNNYLHAAYRIWDVANSEWQIRYEQSTNNGSSWTPGANIREGSIEPVKGYVYLVSDSIGDLHTVYSYDEYFEYKNSNDGTTWSDIEIADPDKPSGDDDFMPKMFITSDDIMHISWIRGDASSGYGDICHRMRDLQ